MSVGADSVEHKASSFGIRLQEPGPLISPDDAEHILSNSRHFETGLNPPKPQGLAFNVLIEQSDAIQRLDRLGRTKNRAFRLYALCGLILVDLPRAQKLQMALAQDSGRVIVRDSDVLSNETVASLADLTKLTAKAKDFVAKRAILIRYFSEPLHRERLLQLLK